MSSRSDPDLPITRTGVTSMLKKRFDFWLILCVLAGVVMVFLAVANRNGLDLDLPGITR